jgi:DNA-binding NarL/FixJ family response regulator
VIRVLLADDDGLVRSGLRALLDAEEDLTVVGEAADGREAVERARALRPDVVLMDVRMPRLDGVGLLEILRSYLRWNRLPVILLTAEATPDELRRVRDLGVSHVFQKTIYNLCELGSAVDACLTPPPPPDR